MKNVKNRKKLWLLSLGIITVALILAFLARYVIQRPELREKGTLESESSQENRAGNNTETFAYFAYLSDISKISPIKRSIKNIRASHLPERLIIQPGIYRFDSKKYDCRKEGLYRFVNPGKRNEQRIVFKSDLLALISALSWIVTHGYADEGKSYDEQMEKATKTKLFLTCGPSSKLASRLLGEWGYKSRRASAITLDEWNSYDNSHTVIEVFNPQLKKWVVFDIDNNTYFSRNGQLLSLIEFIDQVSRNDYEIKYMARDTKLDVSGLINNTSNYNFDFVSEYITSTEDSLRRWYKRIMQVPLIREGDYHYFYAGEEERARLENHSNYYRYMDRSTFMKKFYP